MSDISIKVHFLGELRSIVRRREIEVRLADGSTVHTLLEHLRETLGEAFAGRVFDQDGHPHRHVSIFVNDRSIQDAEGLQTRLSAGEVDVLILPVFEGGQGHEEGM